MGRLWAKLDRRFGLALVATGAAMLGGCGVSEKEYNALKDENNELREKVTVAETSAREKDSILAERDKQIADLNSKAAPPPAYEPGGGKGSGGGGSGGTVLEIAGDVLFDSGQATVKSSAKKQLDRIVSQLNGQYSGHDVRVEGHTDTDKPKKGKYKTNEALSEARASAVRDYLVSRGVSSGRVNAVGYGDSRPRGSKAASRRVEIVVLGN